MANVKLIEVYVGIGTPKKNFSVQLVEIPFEITEIQLKGVLRDLGFISSQLRSYATTKVYMIKENGTTQFEEICNGRCRTLEELEIKELSAFLIEPGEPEIVEHHHHYHDFGSMKCLYGCPMSNSVEEAISKAESYTLEDSQVEEFDI